MKTKERSRIIATIVMVVVCIIGVFLYRTYLGGRNTKVMAWLRNPEDYPQWKVDAGERCGNSVFLLPTDGYIGYLWGDSFRLFHRHQGIDIFAGTASGQPPVYAPYDGYLTRFETWKSSLIIRVPEDPLHPERQIWLYMTHLAEPAGTSLIESKFPAGATEIPVKAGDLLGYQGNYSGDTANPVGVHLHFSIVMDDGSGKFMNELEISNTLDPSPYFNLDLNAKTNQDHIPVCAAQD
ncbi:MAG: M23 family metallopeptidase [Anaerolineaceae bacterium]